MLRYATILHFIDNERIEVVPIIFTQYASPVCVTPNCTSMSVVQDMCTQMCIPFGIFITFPSNSLSGNAQTTFYRK